jgi:Glyoxalase/Bleomycin resistance protein/Dioxygenase superfamily
MSRIFGDTRQVAYVVPDIQAALKFFVEIAGIGPWFLAEKLTLAGGRYRGTVADVPLAIALANSGGVQFELIQPLDETPSIYLDWLKRHRSQRLIQHYSSWVENYDEVHAAAIARGFEAIFEGRSAYGPFVYFAHSDDPDFMFEVTEFTPPRKSMFAAIAAAAHGWDGRDPVRKGWPVPNVG